jgi:hypothetical protein
LLNKAWQPKALGKNFYNKKEISMKTGLFILSLFASGATFAADSFKVSSRVLNNGELVASPVIELEANKMATVKIGNDFSYSLTVTPQADQSADVATAVTVAGKTITPKMNVTLDKEATVQIGQQTLSIVVSKVVSKTAQ